MRIRIPKFVKNGVSKFFTQLVYRFLWLVFFGLILLSILAIFASKSSASSYSVYNSGNSFPTHQTYFDGLIYKGRDYVIFNSSEYQQYCAVGDLEVNGNYIIGTNIQVYGYYSYGVNRTTTYTVDNDFRLRLDNKFFYTNLQVDVASNLRGGIEYEAKILSACLLAIVSIGGFYVLHKCFC